MDAPYALGLTEKTLAQILQQKWLAEGGICIVETRKDETTEIPESFDLIDERIYGLAKVIFLKLK
ncbi:MAG: RsmD family RNA methyltransferase [Alphaproteobacteria bacterium]|nr:RsmD family RNA methyltransferase [Alphaproteobacteria bacterium]